MYAIETRALCKCYGVKTVVDGVSLAVPEGSVYGFIGPNGAGKSTTMKLLLGLVKPSAGTIRLMGRAMDDKNRIALLRQTGSLIESPAGYGHLTARENLEIVAALKDVPKSEIGRVLEVVGLGATGNVRVRAFSLGMRQRLGIAQALMGNPKLLILDEPMNGLDPEGIREMRDMIRDLPRATGASVLISSHLLGELEQTVSQVGILDRGRLLFQGALAKLREHSRGDVSIRVLSPDRARIVLGDGSFAMEADGFRLPALPDAALAALVVRLADGGAGVVEVRRHTRSLEEIFLSLTGEERA